MGAELSKAEQKELKELFDEMDNDKSGTISIEEITKYFGCSEAEAKELIMAVDKNMDFQINFKEFKTMVSKRFKTLFDSYDNDGDGYITIKELMGKEKELSERFAEVAAKNGPFDAEKFLKQTEEGSKFFANECDSDADGKITFSEFVRSTIKWIVIKKSTTMAHMEVEAEQKAKEEGKKDKKAKEEVKKEKKEEKKEEK